MTATTTLRAVHDLAASNAGVRREAAERLALLGRPEILLVVGPLLASLDDEDPELRLLAAWALLEASPLPSCWVPDLICGLGNAHVEVRVWCCALLGECTSYDLDRRAALRRTAESDPEAEVRATASAALRGFQAQVC